MNQIFKCVCVAALVASPLLVQASKKRVTLDECSQVISFSDVTSEISRQLSLGELPNVALVIKEGAEFPATLVTKISFLTVSQDPYLKVNVGRTCYVRFIKHKRNRIAMYLSGDLVNWRKSATFNEDELVLNIDSNKVNVSIDIPEEQVKKEFDPMDTRKPRSLGRS
jgi:hypothetical protein